MRNRWSISSAAVLTFACVLSIGSMGQALAQDSGKTTKSEKSSLRHNDDKQRASGVVVKVEKVAQTAESKSRDGKDSPDHPQGRPKIRLTINTDAVWRDWSRDQAQAEDAGSTSKDSAKGKNSVATKGEPVDQNSKVVVEIVADTKVETRFRAPEDETSKGDKKPQGATRAEAAKAVDFHVNDLKPGLFIEVDFQHLTERNIAGNVTVIRPITPSKR